MNLSQSYSATTLQKPHTEKEMKEEACSALGVFDNVKTNSNTHQNVFTG